MSIESLKSSIIERTGGRAPAIHYCRRTIDVLESRGNYDEADRYQQVIERIEAELAERLGSYCV